MPRAPLVLALMLVPTIGGRAARDFAEAGTHATATRDVEFDGQTIEVTSPVGSGAFPVALFVPGVTLPCSGPGGFVQTIAHVASHGQHVVCTPKGSKLLPTSKASAFVEWFEHVERLASWAIATPPNPIDQRVVPRLACIGHSAGSGMCHALAAYRRKYVAPDHPTNLQVSALVLLSPVCGSLQDCCYRGGDTSLPFDQGFACSGSFSPVSLATEDFRALQLPILIVVGDRDFITPPNLAHAIYDQQRESPAVLLRVPRGTHCLSDPYTPAEYDKENPHCGCAFGNFFCSCVFVSECRAGTSHNADMLRIVRDASSAWMFLYLSRDALGATSVLDSAASAVWNLNGSSAFAFGATVFRGPALSLRSSGSRWNHWVCEEGEPNKLKLRMRLMHGASSERESPGRVNWNALLPSALRNGDDVSADAALEPMVPPIATAFPSLGLGAEAAHETPVIAGEGWLAHGWDGDDEVLSFAPASLSEAPSSRPLDPTTVRFAVSHPKDASLKAIVLRTVFKADVEEKKMAVRKRSPTCPPQLRIPAKGYIVNENDGGTVIPIEASIPPELFNFQGEWGCPSKVLVGRPRNVDDVASLVKYAGRVRANGLGHSWNTQHVCADEEATDTTLGEKPVNIQMHTITPKAIAVDEEAMTVLVDAGVKTRDLLDYLSEFGEGSGYTLPAFSWFIDQTIGGAVASGTHGSSLEYGSFSSEKQLLGAEMIVANGTTVFLTPGTHPNLMRAARVSAGRLGVITKVLLRIVPEMRVRREMNDRTQYAMFDLIDEGQRAWNENRTLLPALNETQFFWWIQRGHVFHVTFERLEQSQQRRVAQPSARLTGSQAFAAFADLALREVVSSTTSEARDAFITMTEPLYELSLGYKYDQYEISVPFANMGDCFDGLRGLLRRNVLMSQSFYSPALIRFVSQEDGFLSQTEDGPRLYINIEDYLFYERREAGDRGRNRAFYKVMRYFRGDERCRGARLHWGKAGWPDPGCWDGAAEYPDTWCDFGCAALALDPDGKFSDGADVFNWEGSNLETCCTAEHKYEKGPDCVCQSGGRRDCPAPGYTNR